MTSATQTSATQTAERFDDDASRWQAVVQRLAAADGQFYYGVTSTAVFCRPSCASRQPKISNVRYFNTVEQAIAAGFRPCLRCRPLGLAARGAQDQRLIELSRYLQQQAQESLSLSQLGQQVGMSPAHLQRRFKALFGVSPKEFQAAVRLSKLKTGLRRGSGVADAVFEAGYGSTSRVYEQIDGRLGMTPSAYRRGGAGETLHYATRTTQFGPLLMAATARGVCFVQFGESATALIQQLQQEYPHAEWIESNAQAQPELDAWISALDHYLSAGGPKPELPLDLRGTAFQIRVWRFLMGLSEGEVMSYGELAHEIDAPRAVRAVASACAANRIAVLIPCHRVLRGDGRLGGYRWGLERKRALIDAERQREMHKHDS